jgi:hypothetical protein
VKKRLLGIVLTYCTLAAPLVAEAGDRSSWHIGAGTGISHMDPKTENSGYTVRDSNDLAAKVFAGYDWNRRVSLEVFYDDLGEAKLDPDGKLGYQEYGITGTYYFTDRLRGERGWIFYGNVGVGRLENDSNVPFERQSDVNLLFGGGIEQSLTNNLSLRYSVEFFEKDAQLLSVNLLYYFRGD